MAHIQTAKAETMVMRIPAKTALTTAATGMSSGEDLPGGSEPEVRVSRGWSKEGMLVVGWSLEEGTFGVGVMMASKGSCTGSMLLFHSDRGSSGAFLLSRSTFLLTGAGVTSPMKMKSSTRGINETRLGDVIAMMAIRWKLL